MDIYDTVGIHPSFAQLVPHTCARAGNDPPPHYHPPFQTTRRQIQPTRIRRRRRRRTPPRRRGRQETSRIRSLISTPPHRRTDWSREKVRVLKYVICATSPTNPLRRRAQSKSTANDGYPTPVFFAVIAISNSNGNSNIT
jgi:hypothetical protein